MIRLQNYRLNILLSSFSFEFAIEYSNVLEKFLFKDNSIKLGLSKMIIYVLFFASDNYNKIDDKDNLKFIQKMRDY